MPPPTTTTRARAGSAVAAAASRHRAAARASRRSNRGLGGQLLGGLELGHRPLPEVELDGARAVLDHPPQRPAVARHPPPQLGPGDQRVVVPPVVGVAQLGEGVLAQAGLGDRVAELERRLVHARVLVVDDPQVTAVVEHVRGEQVVVARHERLRRQGEDLLDALGERLERDVGGRHPEAVLAHDVEVLAAQREHVEPAEEGRARRAAGAARAASRRQVGGDVGVGPGAAGQEPDDHDAAALEVVDDGRPDAGGGRGQGVDVLRVPVDAEQPGLGRRDPHDDVEPGVGAHPVVGVGQPAGQGRHVTPLPGEDGDAVEQLLEVAHRRAASGERVARLPVVRPGRRARSCRGAPSRSRRPR